MKVFDVLCPQKRPMTAVLDDDGSLWVELRPFRLSPMERHAGLKSCDVRFAGRPVEVAVVSLRWLRERRTGGAWPRRLEALEQVIRAAITEAE